MTTKILSNKVKINLPQLKHVIRELFLESSEQPKPFDKNFKIGDKLQFCRDTRIRWHPVKKHLLMASELDVDAAKGRVRGRGDTVAIVGTDTEFVVAQKIQKWKDLYVLGTIPSRPALKDYLVLAHINKFDPVEAEFYLKNRGKKLPFKPTEFDPSQGVQEYTSKETKQFIANLQILDMKINTAKAAVHLARKKYEATLDRDERAAIQIKLNKATELLKSLQAERKSIDDEQNPFSLEND